MVMMMPRLKLKKIPRKKKIKYLFLIMVSYVVLAYTFYYSFKGISDKTNEEFILFLLNNGNASMEHDYKFPKVINKTMNYLFKIDLMHPDTLFKENIIGYENNADDDEDLERLKQISYYMSDPNKVDISKPIIYLYNSHQLENYNNDNLSVYGITPNVLMASYLLKEKLNDMGIPSIVEDTNITEFLTLNHWSYGESYKASRMLILDKKNTYDSLKYYIDIHRDSVSKKITTVKINNKQYARILFVVGLEHKNYQDNLKIVTEINDMFDKYYPGLSRGIYKKEGANVNGIYNQDISKNVMLIELGGVDNNINEVVNTINAICDILSRYINEKK